MGSTFNLIANPQAPNTPNPIEAYARIMGIKAMQQEQQTRELQQQELGLGVQQQQMSLDSQKAIMQAYNDSNGDLDKTLELAAKSGKALPGDLFKIRQTDLAQREMLGKIQTQDLANQAT